MCIDHNQSETHLSRRGFLGAATVASCTLALPGIAAAAVRRLAQPVEFGVIADVHHDVMHDGAERMGVFLEAMSRSTPDAIVQLGDFAYPAAKNNDIITQFNTAHPRALHVIGNHDTDAGFTKEQCITTWGMPGRYYVQDVSGIQFVVLDGNDRGSPTYSGGYPSYIGEEQVAWLQEQLATLDGPIIVASHQPLAGPYAVDNGEAVQELLGAAADKVILALNGHSHIDEVIRVRNVTYMHVNSASYKWVGGDHQHQSYDEAIHEAHPWIAYTCPYRDALYATLRVDPKTHTIRVTGTSSTWVGPSPAELGIDKHPNLINGEHITPRIRDRKLVRVHT